MDTKINLTEFIINILKYYDEQNRKHSELFKQEVNIDVKNSIISFDEISYDYELLAYFDEHEKIWIWAWLLSTLENTQNKLSRDLLNWGLDLSPSSNTDDHYMFKSLLVNSRIRIDESVQLDINLALCSYLLRDRILFIYPNKKYIDNDKYIIFYYLIKKNIN